MPQFEGKVVIERDPSNPSANGAKLSQAAAGTKVIADQIKERRKQIHTQARADLGPAPPVEVEVVPPPAREDLETIEFTAPNGMVIVYGPRTDISLIDRIARIYSGREHSMTEFRITRVLMGIRFINGTPPTTVVDEITRTKIANQVGDDVIDLLLYFDRINWPPLQQSELPLLKKKLRT